MSFYYRFLRVEAQFEPRASKRSVRKVTKWTNPFVNDGVRTLNPLDSGDRNLIYRNPSMKKDLDRLIPLAPATLHILLALAAEDLHGYGIMQEVSRQSEGRYRLGPGTLYDNLQRQMNQGLVEEAPRRPRNQDSRRRYYRLSAVGRGVLAAEIARLEGVVREARLHLSTARPRRAL